MGRIAAETAAPYPPGVPALAPGERIHAATLAALPAFVDDDRPDMLSILQAVRTQNPSYTNISAVDKTGRATVSPSLAIGYPLGDRLHLRNTLESGRFAAGAAA